MGRRQEVSIDTEGECRIGMAEIFGQFLDGDATGKHDTSASDDP
jgi:hypothetical protein